MYVPTSDNERARIDKGKGARECGSSQRAKWNNRVIGERSGIQKRKVAALKFRVKKAIQGCAEMERVMRYTQHEKAKHTLSFCPRL